MRLPDKPPLSPKHREERLKLAANGLQNLALALFAGVLIAPVLNPALIAPLPVRLAAVALAGLAVLVAFILLRYIPVAPDTKEPPHG